MKIGVGSSSRSCPAGTVKKGICSPKSVRARIDERNVAADIIGPIVAGAGKGAVTAVGDVEGYSALERHYA